MQEQILDSSVALVKGPGDELGVQYSQEIPDHFIDSIHERFTGANDPTGNLLFVGSVPAAVADRWMREGYNVFEEPVAKTLAKLRAENMGKFIATSKRI